MTYLGHHGIMLTHLELHETLRVLRERAGLTQLEVAEHLGVREKTVSRWETKISQPSYAAVVRMSHLFASTDDEMDVVHQMLSSSIQPITRESARVTDGDTLTGCADLIAA